MHCVRKVADDIFYVGASDRRAAKFESLHALDNGMAYNSYLIVDGKTVLIDCCDRSVEGVFMENVEHVLQGRRLDYVVVQHMEPDHSATLADLLLRHPEATVAGSARTRTLLGQFFPREEPPAFLEVREGDALETGRHSLRFIAAPMVHWPEVVVTFDAASGILFSADAFGAFGALSGNIFADESDAGDVLLDEARRYYFNIVGKYGAQVQALLGKAAKLDLRMICPLHGPLWREDLPFIVGKYDLWSRYGWERDSVLVLYGSVYGNTENLASVLCGALAERGVRNLAMYDVSRTETSKLLAECFRYRAIVFASSSLNAGLFPAMEGLLLDLKAHLFQNRTVALVQNGSWAPSALRRMEEIVGGMRNIALVRHEVDIRSSLKEAQLPAVAALADALAAAVAG